MPRHRDRVTSYPNTSIMVHSLHTDSWDEIPLDSIQSVTPPDDDGSIEVVYSVMTIYKDGRIVSELKSGESTIDRLFIALGWHADHDPRGGYTVPLHH
jgi:hypothetical protein